MKQENKKIKIVHYCASSYFLGDFGGVPRFDYQLSLVFPNRRFIQEGDILELLNYLYQNNDAIVLTDNHLSLEIPNDIKTIVVHHGCAKYNYLMNKHDFSWFIKYVQPQSKMFYYRSKESTIFLSISEFTSKIFQQFYPIPYKRNRFTKILHPSELNQNIYKTEFNNKPIILGDWRSITKGEGLIKEIKKNLIKYKFKKLDIDIKKPYTNEQINLFNKEKQKIYLNSDLFLNLSNSEGYSYAAVDAMICGLPIVTTRVGVFFNDVPSNCYVELDLEKLNDFNYLEERIEYAWQNRYELSKNIREYYLDRCNFNKWEKELRNLITNFNNEHIKPSNKLRRTMTYLFLYLKILASNENHSFQKLRLSRMKNTLLKICLVFLKFIKILKK